eukprot:GILK01007976.1.p1 GENE.GILK01007976.1~~GILK01007976.1.p1  ORF type:complete len:255 (+),score=9.14 GILK01007976.1:37-801(+)
MASAFKEAEKRYKRYKNVDTDLSSVLSCPEGEVFELPSHPGFKVLPKFLSQTEQLDLASVALQSMVEPPNRTNLTAFEGASASKFWPGNSLLAKLRWATIGYHYDWTNRVYEKENPTPFPPIVRDICERVATAAGTSDFRPEAAILNLYPPSATLGGHLDDVEESLLQPVLSISLGLDCIFLLGGETKEEAPVALRLRSGDCVVMGGRSRTCYHGVPRILEGTFSSSHPCNPEYEAIKRYLEGNRLNLNVRQVF